MQYAKVHPLDPQENISDGKTYEPKGSREVADGKALKCLNQVPRLPLQTAKTGRNSSIKCLQDMLQESQSEVSSSVDSCSPDFEVIVLNALLCANDFVFYKITSMLTSLLYQISHYVFVIRKSWRSA